MNINVKEIFSLYDPKLDGWLDIYQTAFPLNEQMLVSSLIRAIRENDPSEHFLAVSEEGKDEVIGMFHFKLVNADTAMSGESPVILYLLYLAVSPDKRNKGLGTMIYRDWIIPAAKQYRCSAIVLEVEKPEIAMTISVKEAEMARRRIEFYRRNGARLLEGVQYIQSVGRWQPSTEMCLMIHPLIHLSPDDAYSMMKKIFHDSVKQVGNPSLT